MLKGFAVFVLLLITTAAVSIRAVAMRRRSASNADRRELLVDLGASGGVFAALGPLLGLLVVSILAAQSLPNLLFAFNPFFVFFAYWFGLVPALLTGLIAGAARPWLTSWTGFAVLAVTGGVMASIFGLIVTRVDVRSTLATTMLTAAEGGLMLAFIPGAIATVLCALVTRRLRPLSVRY